MDVNVKVTVPALEKLVDYAASGIGAVAGPMLAPWKAGREAKARRIEAGGEADSLKLIAHAQADARRSLVAPHEAGRGALNIGPEGIAQRIEFQNKKRQANIVSVVHAAAAELEGKEVPDHEPDPDWTARFFDSVQDVSSDDMRKLWAKILSGEVEAPGRTSLRTLDILKNMTKKDAQLFNSVGDYVIRSFVYYPREYKSSHGALSYHNILHLEFVGLLRWVAGLSQPLEFHQESGGIVDVQYQNQVLRISTEDKPKRILIPVILLTEAGSELCRILECTVRMHYLQSFSKFLHRENCNLSCASIIENLPNGSVNVSDPFTLIEPEP